MSYRPRLYGTFNCREWSYEKSVEMLGSIVYVDGKQIKEVWFVDTEAGIVKTMDVFRDGKPRANKFQ